MRVKILIAIFVVIYAAAELYDHFATRAPTPPSTSAILAHLVTETKKEYEFPLVFNDIAYWQDISSEGNKLIFSYQFLADSTELDTQAMADLLQEGVCQKFSFIPNSNDVIFVFLLAYNDKTAEYQVPGSDCTVN